jgi:hypothetical protein
MESKRFELNKEDLKSLGITMAIVVGSAVVGQLIEVIPQVNFGEHSEIITVILIALCKTLQKYITGRSK